MLFCEELLLDVFLLLSPARRLKRAEERSAGGLPLLPGRVFYALILYLSNYPCFCRLASAVCRVRPVALEAMYPVPYVFIAGTCIHYVKFSANLNLILKTQTRKLFAEKLAVLPPVKANHRSPECCPPKASFPLVSTRQPNLTAANPLLSVRQACRNAYHGMAFLDDIPGTHMHLRCMAHLLDTPCACGPRGKSMRMGTHLRFRADSGTEMSHPCSGPVASAQGENSPYHRLS